MTVPAKIHLFLAAACLWTATVAASGPRDELFATGQGFSLTVGDYADHLRQQVRAEYYHGTPPEAELAKFQRKVANDLIDQELMATEARRRGLKTDEQALLAALAQIEAQLAGQPQLEPLRDSLMASAKRQLERTDLASRLENQLRTPPPAQEDDVHTYYLDHPELFTAPEQVRVSLMMLRVDPGAPSELWQLAEQRAAELLDELRAGADFAQLARENSEDPSVEAGGDMGYLHRGMLAEPIEAALDSLSPGELAEPIPTLEGVAVLRLDDRIAPRLQPYPDVRDRARGLHARERGERALESLKAALRARAAPISVREDLLAPLDQTTN